MNIAEKIDRGVQIIALMVALKKELEGITEDMGSFARRHPEQHKPLGDPEREGRQFLAKGLQFTVPVVLTADKIVGEFSQGGDKATLITAAAGDHFNQFFKPVKKWENRIADGKKFRDLADELLGAAAPAFVTACKALDKDGIPKSDVKIEWQSAVAAKKLEELGSEVAA